MKTSIYNLLKPLIAICILGGIGLWFVSNQDVRPERRASLEEEDDEHERYERTAPQARWEAEFEMIKDPATGKIPAGIRKQEVDAALKVSSYQLPENTEDKTIPTIDITPRGPNNYGGRTRALGFDIRDANIVISGGVTSGIYRSADGGTSWTRVTPAGEIHNLTCVAQDPRVGHQDIWYAGTGEGGSGSSASATGGSYRGHGIFKSTDNGLTWTAMANTQTGSLENYDVAFDIVHRMVVNPDNGNLLVAASDIITHLNISTNTWTDVLGSLANNAYGDVIYNATGDKFYAALHGQDGSGGIHQSTDGTTWTQVGTTAQLNPAGDAGFGYDVERIILANVANTDDILAFFELAGGYGFTCGNGGYTEAGLAHYDGTATWTVHTDNIGDCSNSSTSPKVLGLQGGYNMALATKPNDANLVYLAGTEGYRYNLSTNAYEFIGGSQQEANAINLHVDQHIFMFEPGSNDIMWAGNDGGLRKTDVTGTIKTTSGDDNGYDWTSRVNGYNGYQYYGVDIDPANGSNFVAGGAQDNAFTIQPVDATADEVGPTADGVDVAIISGGSNFTTHNFFMMWQNGSMLRFENGAQATGVINPAATDFVGSFYLDADNTNYMYFPSASGDLYRTRIAESISATTTTGDSSTGWESLTGVSTAVGSNKISAMDATRDNAASGFVSTDYTASDSNRKLYLGTANGLVFRLDDPAFAAASTTPVTITPAGSSGFVSDIAVNPEDDKEILVTYSNYGVNSVYHTADASVASPTWTNVEGPTNSAVQLASARSAMIVKTPTTTVYLVGTSTGLYATDVLSGETTAWTRLGTTADLGLAVTVEMRLRKSDNKLAVGTHGNGMFLLGFPAALPVDLISFKGEAIDKGNLLTWETASETNNVGFEVEKSADSRNFTKAGFVEGNQTTSTAQDYSFVDTDVKEELTYYRLKQLDADGAFTYSNIISISNKRGDDVVLNLYPNPVVNNLTIENGEGQVTIYNITGKLLIQTNITDSKQAINVADLPVGTYVIRIQKAGGQVVSREFVRAN